MTEIRGDLRGIDAEQPRQGVTRRKIEVLHAYSMLVITARVHEHAEQILRPAATEPLQ